MGKANEQPITDADVLDDQGQLSDDPPKGERQPPKSTKQGGDSEPKKIKLTIGSEEIETDEASARVIKALMGQVSSVQSEFEAFKTGYTKPTPKPPAEDAYDYETGLFTEPAEALKRLRAEIKKEIMGEVRGEYNAVESKKQFWGAFYSENADLKDEKILVEAVLQANYAKLSKMQVGEAAAELSKLTKKELLRIRGGKTDSDDSSTTVEGSSTKFSTRKPTQNGDDTVLSLSELIRKRQEARRKAQFSRE